MNHAKSAIRAIFRRASIISPQLARGSLKLFGWNDRLYAGAAHAFNFNNDLSCNVKKGELQGYRFEMLFFEEYLPLVQNKMEPACSRLLRLLNLEDRTAIDIGASYGYYAVLLSDIVGKNGRVYSFEPDSSSFVRLTHNLKVNNLSNVISLPYAVSDQHTVGYWFENPDQPWLGHQENLDFLEGRSSPNVIPIVGLSLDLLEPAILFEQVAIVKIDVEGHEGAVLRGAGKLFVQYRPYALIELHSSEVTKEVFDILAAYGYIWSTVEYVSETRHHILAYPKERSQITESILSILFRQH